MGNKKLKQLAGWMLVLLSLSIILFRRIAGIDLTEGQLLVQDWPWWVAAMVCCALGVWLSRRQSLSVAFSLITKRNIKQARDRVELFH